MFASLTFGPLANLCSTFFFATLGVCPGASAFATPPPRADAPPPDILRQSAAALEVAKGAAAQPPPPPPAAHGPPAVAPAWDAAEPIQSHIYFYTKFVFN